MNIFKYIKKAIVFALVVFSLSLALQSPSYAAGLEGKWKLTSLNNSLVPEQLQITAAFDTDESVITGNAGPIPYFGSYKSTDNTIELAKGVVKPPIYLGPEPEEYFSTLSSAKSYDLSGQKLTISSDSGRKLSFIKAE
ncbi:META domain-containing protein [Nostoc sp. C052]|uniref:META domain-containing protein n=1 Tax=Nostoc sp. C052 TaxID=2576902 RepID=UPI0015C2E8FF|nr:META domain-containing protein [Nostoc sp. C052]QLE42018.1 META domain-containing protein [Nostoc sp. C052]